MPELSLRDCTTESNAETTLLIKSEACAVTEISFYVEFVRALLAI